MGVLAFRAKVADLGGITAYDLNESSGTNLDDFMGSNDGTAVGASIASTTNGFAGRGRNLDGTDDRLELPLNAWANAVTASLEFTIYYFGKIMESDTDSLMGMQNAADSLALEFIVNEALNQHRVGWRTPLDVTFLRGSFPYTFNPSTYYGIGWRADLDSAVEGIDVRINGANPTITKTTSDPGQEWGTHAFPFIVGAYNDEGTVTDFSTAQAAALAFFDYQLSDAQIDELTATLTTTDNTNPVSRAGNDLTVVEGDTFTLNFENSYDAEDTSGDPDDGVTAQLIYHPTQDSGSAVTLDESNPRHPTGVAPAWTGTANDELVFELVVEDSNGGMSLGDLVVVTVLPASAGIYSFDRGSGVITPLESYHWDRNA